MAVCYGGVAENCNTFGSLYTWTEAQTACPSGWHLPVDSEWLSLVNVAGGLANAGERLKADTLWADQGNGLDQFGLAFVPGGYKELGADYGLGGYGYWWSATTTDSAEASSWYMGKNYPSVITNSNDRAMLMAVRCKQD
jgi:uncharacterized protein (TIGR02145 family)